VHMHNQRFSNECRGWGYMSELLGAAEEFSRRNGEEYIFLLPSDEGLYGFYERSGYQPLCRQKRIRIKTEDILKLSLPNEYNGIICDDSLYDYADKMYSACGYKTFSNANAGVIYEISGGEFRVTEWRGENFAGAVKVLADMENCGEIIIDLPVAAGASDCCEVIEMNHGMALPLCDDDSDDSCFFLNYVLD
ncbi:MAG: GNAT family N-acetyltransferase, partial [Clostridia bacterium]|nr:GNAT family N-acetyltransferase [Clostridia bacterium]